MDPGRAAAGRRPVPWRRRGTKPASWGGGGAGSGRDVPTGTAVLAVECSRRFRASARCDTTARASRATQEAGGPGPLAQRHPWRVAEPAVRPQATSQDKAQFTFSPAGLPTARPPQQGQGTAAKPFLQSARTSQHDEDGAGRERWSRSSSARSVSRHDLLLTSEGFPQLPTSAYLLIQGGVAPPEESRCFPHFCRRAGQPVGPGS